MLRLSKKMDYAVIILSHLHSAEAPISALEVASMYQLPPSMIANILKELSAADWVTSKRGQQGGYILSKKLSDISMAELVQLMEGTFSFVECATDEHCSIYHQCPTRSPLLALHAEIQKFLESFTLDQIVNHPQCHCQERVHHEATDIS